MLAVVFPGQGSQRVGMSVDFARQFPEAQAVFEEANEAFGGPLADWISKGPEETLRRTEITQPAILTASIAAYRVLESRLPLQPSLLAGHSLGEYSALVAAGALDLAEAVRLVARRGRYMQEAVPDGEGGMAAVLGLDGEAVSRICREVGGTVAPANFNSPVQTVIAGERAALEAAGAALKSAGAKRIVPLEVSAPFHSELMQSAMEKLGADLADAQLRDLRIPVVSNVTAKPYRTAGQARTLLRDQVCAPVRWVESVQALRSGGAVLQLEVGPGEVLTGLAGRIDRALARARLSVHTELDAALAAVQEIA
jgi:[acyl-carrier-protein] S-malonyltransferase